MTSADLSREVVSGLVHLSVSTDAACYTTAAIGGSFGLSRTSATRTVRTGNDAKQPG